MSIGEKLAGAMNTFFETIKKEMADLSYMEIVTVVGDPKTAIDAKANDIVEALNDTPKLTIVARTRIELDGDIAMIVPSDEDTSKLRQDIMALHKENAAAAVNNWNTFVKNILLAAVTIFGVVSGDSKPGEAMSKMLQDFKDVSAPGSSTSKPEGSTSPSGTPK